MVLLYAVIVLGGRFGGSGSCSSKTSSRRRRFGGMISGAGENGSAG
jgi:hypothetical protein